MGRCRLTRRGIGEWATFMKLAFASLVVAAFVYTLPVQWRTPPTLQHSAPLALPTESDQPDPYARPDAGAPA